METFPQRKSQRIVVLFHTSGVVRQRDHLSGIIQSFDKQIGINRIVQRILDLEATATFGIIESVGNTTHGHEYHRIDQMGSLEFIAIIILGLSLTIETEVVAMGQTSRSLPKRIEHIIAGKLHRNIRRYEFVRSIGKITRMDHVVIIRNPPILRHQIVIVAHISIGFVTVGTVTAEETVGDGFRLVGVVETVAVDIIHIVTNVDSLAYIQSQSRTELFLSRLIVAMPEIEHLSGRTLGIVESGCKRIYQHTVKPVHIHELRMIERTIEEHLALPRRVQIAQITDGKRTSFGFHSIVETEHSRIDVRAQEIARIGIQRIDLEFIPRAICSSSVGSFTSLPSKSN